MGSSIYLSIILLFECMSRVFTWTPSGAWVFKRPSTTIKFYLHVIVSLFLLISSAMAFTFPMIYAGAVEVSNEELRVVLVRAQYSASIGGQNEPVPNVRVEYGKSGSNEIFVAITNEYGCSYIALERGQTYVFKIQYEESQKEFRLEYDNQSTLLIRVDVNEKSIVDCAFLSARPSSGSYDPASFSSLTFYLSHVIAFCFGFVLSFAIIRIMDKGRRKL